MGLRLSSCLVWLVRGVSRFVCRCAWCIGWSWRRLRRSWSLIVGDWVEFAHNYWKFFLFWIIFEEVFVDCRSMRRIGRVLAIVCASHLSVICTVSVDCGWTFGATLYTLSDRCWATTSIIADSPASFQNVFLSFVLLYDSYVRRRIRCQPVSRYSLILIKSLHKPFIRTRVLSRKPILVLNAVMSTLLDQNISSRGHYRS